MNHGTGHLRNKKYSGDRSLDGGSESPRHAAYGKNRYVLQRQPKMGCNHPEKASRKRPGGKNRHEYASGHSASKARACKNDFAHKELSKQFKERQVVRRYIAIVNGVIEHNLGRIDAPIGRSPVDRKMMAVVEDGKPAVTNFKVIERLKKHTVIELHLETGRTHQIRVHMQYIGYPVAGDPMYGTKKDISKYGQYLHAFKLGFVHPRTHEYLEFNSPLPDFFVEYLEKLRKEEE